MTAVNVLNAEPLIFDSSKQQITSRHILAATGYQSYYFQWAEVEKGVYAWDGSLLSKVKDFKNCNIGGSISPAARKRDLLYEPVLRLLAKPRIFNLFSKSFCSFIALYY
jgi:hypothetical protein